MSVAFFSKYYKGETMAQDANDYGEEFAKSLRNESQYFQFVGQPIFNAIEKKVHVWTVDSVEEAKNYKEMGLSSITTNIPHKIKSAL